MLTSNSRFRFCLSVVLVSFLGLLILPVTSMAQTHCGTAVLRSLFDSIKKEHRGPFPEYKAAKLAEKAEKPVVGTIRKFWAWDLSVQPPASRHVESLCVAVTDHAYVFVEKALVETHFGPEVTATVVKAFEEACPRFDNRGILDVEYEVFGTPPDALDNDEKVYIFYSHIASYGMQGFDGYFNAFNQLPEEVAWANYKQHSNEVEMLYMNATGSTPADSTYMLSVLSHEFLHLIHHNYDQEEVSWVDEGIAEAAMTVCGYFTDGAHLARYCSKPETQLIKGYASYGAVLLFGTYVYEQFGSSFLTDLVKCKLTGVEGVEAVLKDYGQGDFSTFFHNWAAANLCAGHLSQTEGQFSYKSFPIPQVALIDELLTEDSVSISLKSSGLNYIKIEKSDKQLFLTLSDEEVLNASKVASTKIVDGLTDAIHPSVFFVTSETLALKKLEEINSDDSVSFEVPMADGFIILSTLDCGSLSFTVSLSS